MISVFRGAVDRDATPFLQVCKNVEKMENHLKAIGRYQTGKFSRGTGRERIPQCPGFMTFGA
jgi:hypothetical protein